MRKKALSHFKKADPKLYDLILSFEEISDLSPETSEDRFSRLCRIIVGQQLSSKAARSIWNRFEALFPRKKVTAKKILEMGDIKMRSAGLAGAKVRALKDLAEKVTSREVVLKDMHDHKNEIVHEKLIIVKGIGPWTIEMFLMFVLGREDVFSYGDLGLQKGFQKLYRLKQKPTQKQMERLTKKWTPYRTYAALALWKLADTK